MRKAARVPGLFPGPKSMGLCSSFSLPQTSVNEAVHRTKHQERPRETQSLLGNSTKCTNSVKLPKDRESCCVWQIERTPLVNPPLANSILSFTQFLPSSQGDKSSTQSTQPLWNQSCPFKVVTQRIGDKNLCSWARAAGVSQKPSTPGGSLASFPPTHGRVLSSSRRQCAGTGTRKGACRPCSPHLHLSSLVAPLPQVLFLAFIHQFQDH